MIEMTSEILEQCLYHRYFKNFGKKDCTFGVKKFINVYYYI